LLGGMGIGGKILIFKNKNKKSETDADYYMYLAPKQQRAAETTDDDLPF